MDPTHKKIYKDLLIIGIAESEQNRRVYETHFVEVLKKHGIEAVPSYTLIKSDEKIDRNTVTKAIKGLDIDGVIVTYMTSVDEETIYRPGTSYAYSGGYGYGYGRSLYGYYPNVNSYVHTPGTYTTHETYVLETNLHDVESEEMIWSARSRSFSPESVDQLIVELVDLLVIDLEEKNLIKEKNK